jgi:two-component system LytT family response regulator
LTTATFRFYEQVAKHNQMDTVFKFIVVDDDDIDRLTTVSFLKNYPMLQPIGVYETPTAALDAVRTCAPDILFLDVDMPEMSGLELRKQLMHIPACVFITSYPDYALDGFELAAIDFLVKPYSGDRFAKTIGRLLQYLETRQKADLLNHTLGADFIFIKEGHQQIKLPLHEVIYLEALKDYTRIVTNSKKYCVLTALSSLIKEKGFQNFVRIHRSYAVQKLYVNKVSTKEVFVNDMVLPVGRVYKNSLSDLIK